MTDFPRRQRHFTMKACVRELEKHHHGCALSKAAADILFVVEGILRARIGRAQKAGVNEDELTRREPRERPLSAAAGEKTFPRPAITRQPLTRCNRSNAWRGVDFPISLITLARLTPKEAFAISFAAHHHAECRKRYAMSSPRQTI